MDINMLLSIVLAILGLLLALPSAIQSALELIKMWRQKEDLQLLNETTALQEDANTPELAKGQLGEKKGS